MKGETKSKCSPKHPSCNRVKRSNHQYFNVIVIIIICGSLISQLNLCMSPAPSRYMAIGHPHLPLWKPVPFRRNPHLKGESLCRGKGCVFVLHNEHQKGPVEYYLLRAHPGRSEHEDCPRGCSRLGSRLVHLHHGFVNHLQGRHQASPSHQGLGDAIRGKRTSFCQQHHCESFCAPEP